MPERHIARTSGLARSALDARIEGLNDFIGKRRDAFVDNPHEGDASPRRMGVCACYPVCGAVRKAQSAGHATVEFGLVDSPRVRGIRSLLFWGSAGVEAAVRVE